MLDAPVEFTSPEQPRPIKINPGDLIVADGKWPLYTRSTRLEITLTHYSC